jgi:UDP-N-acetylmuramoyl-L-alanyl-D-glutamate--2,6-diaminopimelate ligase
MKNLRDILYKTALVEVAGDTGISVASVTADSRQVRPGCLFVAIKGLTTDGHAYIEQAIADGAIAIICETMPQHLKQGITYMRVQSSPSALGMVAANSYENPSGKLKLIGITGTNGKTTIASLLHTLFQENGHVSGLISTIHNKIGNEKRIATFTTPDPLQLNSLLSEMVQAGCTHAFMEISSHAMVQQRVEGIEFAGGVFTNLTHDHLDYHGNFMNYLQAKQAFFDMLGKKAFALTNIDDKNGWIMLQNTKAAKHSYSLRTMADFKANVLENNLAGMQLHINDTEVWCKLNGTFNAYNLLATFGTAILLGMDKEQILTTLSLCNPVEGRFDRFTSPGMVTAIIDYAHSPDALENVLKTIHQIRTGKENLITVIGCGGNRDAAKRPLMASIAAMMSNRVILTSDNPRMEDPATIIADMQSGLNPEGKKKTITITNREEAIQAACAMARSGDIILVAGKGHEKTQEIKGIKYPFDDKAITKKYLI